MHFRTRIALVAMLFTTSAIALILPPGRPFRTRSTITHKPEPVRSGRAAPEGAITGQTAAVVQEAPVDPVWAAASADPHSMTVGQPWVGEPGYTETVAQIMARAALEPPESPDIKIKQKKEERSIWRRDLPLDPLSPAVSRWPLLDASGSAQQHHEGPGGPNIPQTLGAEWDGPTISVSGGVIPPDSTGDVGPTQVLVASNGRIRVYDKNGVLGGLNVTLNTFYPATADGGFGCGDPRIRFDRLTNRWFVSAVNFSTPNRVVLGVSNGPTITNSSSFTFYFFQHDTVGATPNADTGGFFDYPSLGVDNNAVYIGGNIFNPGWTGSSGHVIRKSSVLSGGPIVVTAFRQLAAGGIPGPWSPQGVSNDDTSATEGYFIGPSTTVFGRVSFRRVTDPGGAPAISGTINTVVPSTSFPSNVAILGSTFQLDSLDDRIYLATIHENQLTGTRTLWAAHNIRVDINGVAMNNGSRVASRWYEIGDLTSTPPTLVQSGTVFSNAAAPDFDKFWIPSVAMSGQGHAALGCSVGGTLRRAEIAVAGRLASDAAGTMQAPIIAQSTTFNYNTGSNPERWGDYSHTTVDPTDGMTMWTIQEWCNATNSWAVRVIELIAPPPVTPDAAAPPTVNQGDTNVNVVVTGASVSGSGWFDPDVSYPNHIAATVNGGGVTVNSVTFTSPTSLTLNVTVAGGAAVGARTVTVTNPDGQAATSAGGILTVASPVVPASSDPIPDDSTVCGSPYTSAAPVANGTPPLSWVLDSGPPGMTIDANTGVVSWPNPIASATPYTIMVTVSNAGGSDSESWDLTVAFGDFDGDGLVNVADIGPFIDHLLGLSATTVCAGDFDVDGDVDGDDVQSFVDSL